MLVCVVSLLMYLVPILKIYVKLSVAKTLSRRLAYYKLSVEGEKMATIIRTRPEAYSVDGIPIYFHVYKEKDRIKLHMTLRLPKKKVKEGDPSYGKIVYEEDHDLPLEVAKAPSAIRDALKEHAPTFWQNFFVKEKYAEKKALFLEKVLREKEGLPLAIVWAIDHKELATQLEWTPTTIQRKARVIESMLKQDWGAVPIGKLDAVYCGDVFMTEFSATEHRAAVALLKQLAQHEIGHKRLQDSPWSKSSSLRRPMTPKKSSTLVNQHIRPNNLVREIVHRILNEMMELLSQAKEWKFALALLLCLTMGLSLPEICFIKMDAVFCNRDNLPLRIHIKGNVQKRKERWKEESYPETSPKNRSLPVPTKVAYGMKCLLDEWKKTDSEQAYSERYLIPHDKNPQRRMDCEELKKWINKRLKNQLEDNRMHDGQGNVVHPRAPYHRCLSTAKQSLVHAGFETDEFRYFFGYPPSSTAGEFYCDFANDSEQQRMRNIIDQWLGTILPSELCENLALENPSAGTTAVFGAEGQIAHVVLTLDIPPVPEECIPFEGYQMQFGTKLGFSLDVKSRPLAA